MDRNYDIETLRKILKEECYAAALVTVDDLDRATSEQVISLARRLKIIKKEF